MSDDPVNLGERRAEKSRNSCDWTPADMLQAVLREVRRDDVKIARMVVHYYEENADGGRTHHFFAAGMSYPEHIALLRVAETHIIQDWLA